MTSTVSPATPKRGRMLRGCGLAGLLLIVLCCVVPVVWFIVASTPPSDDHMISEFTSHRPTFDLLLSMFRDDTRLRAIDYDSTYPDDAARIGVSAQRLEQYRALFRQINLSGGIAKVYDSGVDFDAWTSGWQGGGRSKSYAYLPVSPTPLVNDIDNYRPPGRSAGYEVYRHIEGNWYLYYGER